MADRAKDIRFWLAIGFILFGVIGIYFEKLTWSEAGGVAGPVAAAYMAVTAVQQLIASRGNTTR
jgi:hypothetical protein